MMKNIEIKKWAMHELLWVFLIFNNKTKYRKYT